MGKQNICWFILKQISDYTGYNYTNGFSQTL